MYMGGKIGGYRVLSSSLHTLDSGICVRIDELPSRVFPAPNEHGVFDRKGACTTIAFALDHRFKVSVSYVQAGPDTWCAEVDELTVSHCSSHSPISMHRTYPTLHAALLAVVPALLVTLRDLAQGTDEELYRRWGTPKSLCGKARRFGNNAVYSIISAIPRPTASDILKSLKG
jgi:hypothetical protein